MRFDSDSGLFGSATRPETDARREKPARAQVRDYLGELAGAYGLPVALVQAVAQTESNFDTGHTRAKRGATHDDFEPENTGYGVMQVRDDQIGRTVPAPDGSAHEIGNDIKTNWRANARAGVALLAQQYHLATLENPFGSEPEHAQQAYAGYSGGTSYRDRYLQTLPYDNQPAHPDDRSFLENFMHVLQHRDGQVQDEPQDTHDLLYRRSDPQGHLETIPVRPRRQGEQDDLLLLSAAPDETQGTAGKSNASPLPAPLQRLKENPGNLFGLKRGQETAPSADGNVNSPQAAKGTPSSTSSRRPSLRNIGPLFSSTEAPTQPASPRQLPQPLERLKEDPENLFLKVFLHGGHFSQVNLNVVSDNEGGNQARPYFPDTYGQPPGAKTEIKHSKAGITIGLGVDLGHTNREELKRIGVSQTTIDKLQPYLGRMGEKAVEALAEHKRDARDLTPAELSQLNRAVMTSKFNEAGKAYSNASAIANFTDLPWQAQTVIADLWYNRGNLERKAPTFWREVTTGRWEDAVQNLQNLKSGDHALDNRARRDAEYLRQALASRELLPRPQGAGR